MLRNCYSFPPRCGWLPINIHWCNAELKSRVDLHFLPPNRVGGAYSPSLTILLTRPTLNWVSLQCHSLRWNSETSEFNYLNAPKIYMYIKPRLMDTLYIEIHHNHKNKMIPKTDSWIESWLSPFFCCWLVAFHTRAPTLKLLHPHTLKV